jgi:hypothetical protein
MEIPLAPDAGSGCRTPRYVSLRCQNTAGRLSFQPTHPSITFVEHLFDRVRGRIPAFARTVTNVTTNVRGAMPDGPGGIRRTVADLSGNMRRTVSHIAGAVTDGVTGVLRILLDGLAGSMATPCEYGAQ